MKINNGEQLPNADECAGSLRNIIDALYVLNGKWKIALILSLIQSPKRFNELKKEIAGISAKILAKELKDLELNDFVKRNVNSATPLIVTYEATDYSLTLRGVISELSTWGKMHREKVKESMRK